MCGIVGAVAERNVTPILLEGLRRLEYRGYDSAGIAVIDNKACLERVRRVGKVQSLSDSLDQSPIKGQTVSPTHIRISVMTRLLLCITVLSKTTAN